jgi:DNA polymerase (family 10)
VQFHWQGNLEGRTSVHSDDAVAGREAVALLKRPWHQFSSKMRRLPAPEVALLLREFGQRAALRGGNPYRAKAYTRAAENLLALTEPLETLVAEDRLTEIPGVGNAIADIIRKLHEAGEHPSLQAMRKDIPTSALEMLGVPGLRPDKVLKLYRELGIASLNELEKAAKEGRLKPVEGLGAALQSKILQGIEIRRKGEGQRHLHRAAMLLQAAEEQLRRSKSDIKQILPAGDFRRGCELVADLAIVVETKDLEGEPRKVASNSQLGIWLTDKRRLGATLLMATGSEKHLKQLRALAEQRGKAFDQTGLRTGKRVIAPSEKDIYAELGLQYIEPELREGCGEIELAKAHKIPRLVTDGDIRGILHAHTDRSDGVDTLEVMAEATRRHGYEYFGVADHSRSAHYAGGLSIEEIAEQHAEIDSLNKWYGGRFRIFKGIESDILADGSLDYPDEILAGFEFVVASVHSRFKLSSAEQTERILTAIANPRTTILGHMTGRQLLRRPGYEIDIEKILRACAKHGVAIEINANPWRLDLDWRWHRQALEPGCMMSINPDAHSTSEIDLTHWGVEMARKGGVPQSRVLNCLRLQEITEFLTNRHDAQGPRSKSAGTSLARAGGSCYAARARSSRPRATSLARRPRNIAKTAASSG